MNEFEKRGQKKTLVRYKESEVEGKRMQPMSWYKALKNMNLKNVDLSK